MTHLIAWYTGLTLVWKLSTETGADNGGMQQAHVFKGRACLYGISWQGSCRPLVTPAPHPAQPTHDLTAPVTYLSPTIVMCPRATAPPSYPNR